MLVFAAAEAYIIFIDECYAHLYWIPLVVCLPLLAVWALLKFCVAPWPFFPGGGCFRNGYKEASTYKINKKRLQKLLQRTDVLLNDYLGGDDFIPMD
jgi:hypothetical protein